MKRRRSENGTSCRSGPCVPVLTTPAGSISILRIQAYEKSMIVIKLRGARQRTKLKRGSREGRKPFGSYPGETETLKRIEELDASGETTTAIANRLRAEGRKTRSGGEWL